MLSIPCTPYECHLYSTCHKRCHSHAHRENEYQWMRAEYKMAKAYLETNRWQLL